MVGDAREQREALGSADAAPARDDALRVADVDLAWIRGNLALDSNGLGFDAHRVDSIHAPRAIRIGRGRLRDARLEREHGGLCVVERNRARVAAACAQRDDRESTVATDAGLQRGREESPAPAHREARGPFAAVGCARSEHHARNLVRESRLGIRKTPTRTARRSLVGASCFAHRNVRCAARTAIDDLHAVGTRRDERVGVRAPADDQRTHAFAARVGEFARVAEPLERGRVDTLIDHPDATRGGARGHQDARLAVSGTGSGRM